MSILLDVISQHIYIAAYLYLSMSISQHIYNINNDGITIVMVTHSERDAVIV